MPSIDLHAHMVPPHVSELANGGDWHGLKSAPVAMYNTSCCPCSKTTPGILTTGGDPRTILERLL